MNSQREGEQGFLLVGLVVAIFIILLVLGVAAPTVARDLRREREMESVHRGNQYVRAIQLYYKKLGHYPGSMEQLDKTNNIRYLRQRYVDPMTGKADWRLIKVGEAKTTVKGFFGQPLAGVAPAGLGTAAGMVSPGTGAGSPGSSGSSSAYGSSSGGGFGSTSGGGFGSTSGGGFGSTMGGFGSSSASGSTGSTTTGTGSTDTSGASGGTGSSGSSSGIGSQSATSFSGGGAPFVGVGIPKSGDSIINLNAQTTYQTWEFIYDPRIEQLKARASLFGGGPATASGGGLGSASGSASPGLGGTSPTSPTTTPTTPSSPPSTTPQ
jgi:type II secretory pathway pseudopilin PulG